MIHTICVNFTISFQLSQDDLGSRNEGIGFGSVIAAAQYKYNSATRGDVYSSVSGTAVR